MECARATWFTANRSTPQGPPRKALDLGGVKPKGALRLDAGRRGRDGAGQVAPCPAGFNGRPTGDFGRGRPGRRSKGRTECAPPPPCLKSRLHPATEARATRRATRIDENRGDPRFIRGPPRWIHRDEHGGLIPCMGCSSK